MIWKIFKDNKSLEKNKQKKKYEMIYNNLTHSNEKDKKNEIEMNKNIISKSINANNAANSINIINNINNTINNYGTLNIFQNKTQIPNNKMHPQSRTRLKNEIKNIKKINSNMHSKNGKSFNLNYIKKNIRSTNSSKSNKKDNNRNKMNSISKSYKPNKKTKSRTITSNKENHNKNINLVNNKKKFKF
jgi:hypothetical protein